MGKPLKRSLDEAYAVVTAAHALAKAAVHGGVPYAAVAKVLRSALKVQQERFDAERRKAKRERRLRRQYGDAVAEARLAAEQSRSESTKVDDLQLSLRALNECQRLGILAVGDLLTWSPTILRSHGVGLKTIREFQATLESMGKSLLLYNESDREVLTQQMGAGAS